MEQRLGQGRERRAAQQGRAAAGQGQGAARRLEPGAGRQEQQQHQQRLGHLIRHALSVFLVSHAGCDVFCFFTSCMPRRLMERSVASHHLHLAVHCLCYASWTHSALGKEGSWVKTLPVGAESGNGADWSGWQQQEGRTPGNSWSQQEQGSRMGRQHMPRGRQGDGLQQRPPLWDDDDADDEQWPPDEVGGGNSGAGVDIISGQSFSDAQVGHCGIPQPTGFW